MAARDAATTENTTTSDTSDPGWTSGWRKPGVGGELLGTDERSRQIERNLGIQ